jgi:dipeptidyl aminopeptidase/acylaminoacyl peptidase
MGPRECHPAHEHSQGPAGGRRGGARAREALAPATADITGPLPPDPAVNQTGGDQDVWVRNLPTGPLTKLSFEGSLNDRAAWTPDGRTIGYITNRNGSREFWAGAADGSAPPEPLIRRSGRQVNEAIWSPDGKWLLSVLNGDSGIVYARRTTGDTTTMALTLGPKAVSSISLSPPMAGTWRTTPTNRV